MIKPNLDAGKVEQTTSSPAKQPPFKKRMQVEFLLVDKKTNKTLILSQLS
jgi:hypothetical protein